MLIPPAVIKPAAIDSTHGIQIIYLITLIFELTGLLFTLVQQSCKLPAGQIQPQKALPKNNEVTNRLENSKKLPEAIPSKLPETIK